jgi:hydroxymethylbilane synthase
MKDMPVNLPPGCVIAAVLPRASAHDVLITKNGGGLDSLPLSAVIGTSSLRRRAQVRLHRKDAECVTCRGNVGTRLGRLERGEFDALIMAEAGLNRLGLNLERAARLPFITSAGQGAIAIETRSGSWMEGAARELNHFDTWRETTAERELLRLMGLGCACPIGVRGKMRDGIMDLTAEVYSAEPKDNPEDERASLRLSGRVESDEDAKDLACRIWNEMRELPLMTELAAFSGEFRK